MLTVYQKRRLVYYHINSRRLRLTTKEGYDFAFMPKGKNPSTACWRYDNARKRHNLVINEAIDEMADKKGPRSSIVTYAERVYDHEGAHSLYTDRDNPSLKALQDKWKIPFPLWNLFEDARIEACWRKRIKRRFGWSKYMLSCDGLPLPKVKKSLGGPMNPNMLMLDCIHFENSPKMLKDWVAKDPDPKVQYESKGKFRYGRRHLIRWYYRRAIKAKNTKALVWLVVSWIKTFPDAIPTYGSGEVTLVCGEDMIEPGEGSAGSGEMPAGATDADGKKHKEIKETISGSGAGESSVESTKPVDEKAETYKYEGESKVLEIPETRFFCKTKQRTINFKKGENLIRLFEKFLEGGEGMVTSRNPTNKINMDKFLRGSEDFYMRKGDDPYGVKKISFFMDCSGSMSRAIDDGVYLAYVMNELVKRRKIECQSMILCGGPNQRVPMPFDSRILEHVHAPGAHEGFAKAMRDHEKELVSGKLAIFFTDGNITDEHIVKADWHRKGVYSIGLFVGAPERSSTLHQWFDSVLVRNDIESVADSLVQLIKQ